MADDNPDFESLLQRGVRDYGELIALGQPGEAIGSRRIPSSDEEWEETFERLARKASAFIVVPSGNPGTRWEIEWLKRERSFRGCLFVMPAESPGFDGHEFWRRARETLGSTIDLPRFGGAPSFFCFDEAGTVYVVPATNAAVETVDGLVFYASEDAVHRAVEILLPIAKGTATYPYQDFAKVAWTFASRIWSEAVFAWVEGHPARASLPKASSVVPLSLRPASVVWGFRKEITLEFKAAAPMDKVSMFVMLGAKNDTVSVVGHGVELGDADGSLSSEQRFAFHIVDPEYGTRGAI